MSESPETTAESVYAGPVVHEHRDHRLHRVLAWVGIVAGVVFIVAVVFFSGLALGRSSGYHGWHRGYPGPMGAGQMGPGQGGGCPMMRSGGMMGPGGMDPDDMGPGMMRPGPAPSGQAPSAPNSTSSAPSPAPR